MVSKLYKGSTIINAARRDPAGSPFEFRKTPTNKDVLDLILRKYFAGKRFYFYRKWFMSSKRKGDEDEGHKLYSGHEIIQGKINGRSNFLFRTKKVSMTYQMAYDGILNEVVANQDFYHRGRGDWCMYDRERDIRKLKNYKRVPYTDPITGEKSVQLRDARGHFKKGYIGYVTWDGNTNNGAFARDKAHMGDSTRLKPNIKKNRPKAGRR